MLKIDLIPLLTDNYAYLLHDTETNTVGVIDPSEGEPVLAELNKRNLPLHTILCTHHHWDHTNGNHYLKEHTNCQIIGYKDDAHRIPDIDIEVTDKSTYQFGNHQAQILFIPGHTAGHIAYYFTDSNAIFVGDTLFAMGCGRLYEGTPEQMYNSLNLITSLPPETNIYCGHEYTQANAKFALTIEPTNQALITRTQEINTLRKNSQPTIPTTVALEKATNPFVRASSAEEFADIRRKKDVFG